MARPSCDPDFLLALVLQSEFNEESGAAARNTKKVSPNLKRRRSEQQVESSGHVRAKKCQSENLIDPELEVIDPTPDIHGLFMIFNKTFFWSSLNTVEVRWSPRMYKCAGICAYEGRSGLCSIRLSEPLLKLRPRSDLVETLLHEMIHAYLFVTNNNRDRDGHGPEFKKHMYRINAGAGTNITIYHSFHEEVKLYQKHWWRCNGPCRDRHPFFGMVKRTMNRAPGPNDFWWADHQATCGGIFIKVKEPEPKKKLKPISENKRKKSDIREFFNGTKTSNKGVNSNLNGVHITKTKQPVPSLFGVNNEKNFGSRIVGFGDLKNQNQDFGNQSNFRGKGTQVPVIINKNNNVHALPVVKQGGSGTYTVKSFVSNNVEGGVVVKTGSKKFVPFNGAGNVLGGGSVDILNVHTKPNFQPWSSITNDLSIESSPDKYKSDFLNISLSDDELAEIDDVDNRKNNVLTTNIKDLSPEKFKEDFLSISDDELAVAVDQNDCCSPDRVKNKFFGDTNSDDEFKELDTDNIPDFVKCPVCNFQIHRDDMSIHLQSCDLLNLSVEKIYNSPFEFKEIDDKNQSSSSKIEDHSLPCPCCSKYVNETDINQHLDECLSVLAIKEFTQPF